MVVESAFLEAIVGAVVGKGEKMMTMAESPVVVVVVLLLMFLVVFFSFFLFYACSRRWRWRWLRSSTTLASGSRPRDEEKGDDLETPLFSGTSVHASGQNKKLYSKFTSAECSYQSSKFGSPRRQGVAGKQKLVSTVLHATKDDNIVLDLEDDALDDLLVGQTLKRPALTDLFSEDIKDIRKEEGHELDHIADVPQQTVSPFKDKAERICLSLEVISGPSKGLYCSRESTDAARLRVTLGRVPPSDLLLKDSEVSGKHALISWNTNTSKWELVDMGSLNGTHLNSQAIHHSNSGYRCWSEPVELANEDIITLGTSSKLLVHIIPFVEHRAPFGIGIASDPMAMRRGAKRLPMEDMHYCQWPLHGVEQFGLFGIFDGHGGPGAAREACKMLPMILANILSNPERRERVISLGDASEVLRDAFSQTEAAMNHQYEGCTATILLIWADHSNKFFVQCANVGDSACVINTSGVEFKMTEDHRVTSQSEQTRLSAAGWPLKDGETRLCGLNLVRMLGDKFLKEQDPRFSSEPFTSRVVHIKRATMEFALLASDGLWDVISIKRAMQLVLQAKERDAAHDNSADGIANFLLNEARNLRTKDNTSIIFLDFDNSRTNNCKSAS